MMVLLSLFVSHLILKLSQNQQANFSLTYIDKMYIYWSLLISCN